jgi:hypothetical protein
MGFYQLVPTWDDKLMVSLHYQDPKEYFHLRAWLRCASFRMQFQTTQDAQKASALLVIRQDFSNDLWLSFHLHALINHSKT